MYMGVRMCLYCCCGPGNGAFDGDHLCISSCGKFETFYMSMKSVGESKCPNRVDCCPENDECNVTRCSEDWLLKRPH